ncbi:hypothetical protein AB0J68_31365, partial [Micromonospora sp. NPDC049580]|uniref:hypothetical protein n=1 Tax=Micromonospora sp. NPDC049580 TaxID=3154832 RepID=UPI0034335DF5
AGPVDAGPVDAGPVDAGPVDAGPVDAGPAAPPPSSGTARPVPGLLASAERHLRIGTPAELADATTRSHLDDGRCVGWYGPLVPGWRAAIDAERADAPVPPALARRFGAGDFWARWTRAECCCKLADVPIATWWRRHGLGTPVDGTILWRTLRVADLVVTVGFAPRHYAGPTDRD